MSRCLPVAATTPASIPTPCSASATACRAAPALFTAPFTTASSPIGWGGRAAGLAAATTDAGMPNNIYAFSTALSLLGFREATATITPL